jgi:hypothetical protein
MSDLLDLCRWPPLGPIHSAALRSAVEYAVARTNPLGVGAATPVERVDIANSIGDRPIATRGFFEWDSGPEPTE